MDTAAAVAALILAYAIGSIPVAQLVARYTKDVDLRDVGSGNVGASNIWQSVSKWMTIPVGLAQIAQGLVAVLIAKLFGAGDGVQALCGILAVVAHDWNPWLGFTGGRGIAQTIGVMLALSWQSLGVFTLVSLAGVLTGWIPQFVIIALFAAPYGAVVAGQSAATAWGCLAARRRRRDQAPARERAPVARSTPSPTFTSTASCTTATSASATPGCERACRWPTSSSVSRALRFPYGQVFRPVLATVGEEKRPRHSGPSLLFALFCQAASSTDSSSWPPSGGGTIVSGRSGG